ncbi:retrotransposon protein, putative, ty1-copia subclass [Tanacetum coccineum]
MDGNPRGRSDITEKYEEVGNRWKRRGKVKGKRKRGKKEKTKKRGKREDEKEKEKDRGKNIFGKREYIRSKLEYKSQDQENSEDIFSFGSALEDFMYVVFVLVRNIMKSYLDILERLGYVMPNELGVSLILNSLNKDYDQFVQNYNMHNMGETIAELHAMLNLHEKSIPKKVETPAVLAIRAGKIQKDKKKLQGAKGKGEGKNKLAYAPKTKIPSSPKRDNPAKDSVCHHCNEVGLGGEMSVPTGLRRSRKLKHGALSLYMGNGMRVVVEAIRNFDLVLPNGLIIILDNCHFAPTITRGVVSISRLVNNGYIHTFTNYDITVSKDNVFYFNAILSDGIYETYMHNLYPNVSSMFNVSNKRAKHALDSSYLWHCHLGHINKKRMDKFQRDGILQPTHDESLEKCKSCISEKMASKPFSTSSEKS